MEIENLVEKDGKVTVWHLHDKAFIKRWPIDAAEMLKKGEAVLEPPQDASSDEAAA